MSDVNEMELVKLLKEWFEPLILSWENDHIALVDDYIDFEKLAKFIRERLK